MKREQMQELRARSVEELEAEVASHRERLFRGRLAAVTEGKGLGVQAREMRRHVARCLTLIREKTKTDQVPKMGRGARLRRAAEAARLERHQALMAKHANARQERERQRQAKLARKGAAGAAPAPAAPAPAADGAAE